MKPNRFKRFRMKIDLRRIDLTDVRLPEGYTWLPWHVLLRNRHALTKWISFRDDLDGRVFPCLSERAGCSRLLGEITRQKRFCPDATWMVSYQPEPNWPGEDCGTVQGIGRRGGIGAIQNIGVIPEHRSRGLGRALVLKSLQGFWQNGYEAATLEVTALNQPAVKLYRDLGFDVVEVLYREADGGRVLENTRRRPNESDNEAVVV